MASGAPLKPQCSTEFEGRIGELEAFLQEHAYAIWLACYLAPQWTILTIATLV